VALEPPPKQFVYGQTTTTTTEAATTTTTTAEVTTTTTTEEATTTAEATTPEPTLEACHAAIRDRQDWCYVEHCQDHPLTDTNCMQDCYRFLRHADRLYCDADAMLSADAPAYCLLAGAYLDCPDYCLPTCGSELLLGSPPSSYWLVTNIWWGIALTIIVIAMIVICCRVMSKRRHD
jgi:hypothetical protein